MLVRLQNNKEQCYKHEDFLRFYTGEVNVEHIGKNDESDFIVIGVLKNDNKVCLGLYKESGGAEKALAALNHAMEKGVHDFEMLPYTTPGNVYTADLSLPTDKVGLIARVNANSGYMDSELAKRLVSLYFDGIREQMIFELLLTTLAPEGITSEGLARKLIDTEYDSILGNENIVASVNELLSDFGETVPDILQSIKMLRS